VVDVAVGQPIVYRQSTRDFETADDDIPLAVFVFASSDGRNAVLTPGADSPDLGFTVFDEEGPMGAVDRLNRRFDFTFPAQVGLINPDGSVSMVASAGLTFSVIALYLDGYPEGIAAFTIRGGLIRVVAP
jgi:hypothetical protein